LIERYEAIRNTRKVVLKRSYLERAKNNKVIVSFIHFDLSERNRKPGDFIAVISSNLELLKSAI